MARIVIQIDGIDVTARTSTNLHDGTTEGEVADLGLTSRAAQGAALDGGRAPSGPPGPRIDSNGPGAESEPAADAGQAPTDPGPQPNE
jgi:hypothetical protein